MSRYLFVLVGVVLLASPVGALEPPAQPLSGPGGSAARHAAVSRSFHGEGAQAFWLFEPAEPAPASAPVVVFNHGIGATDPAIYAAWIRHLVGRGLTVVYPLYQDGLPADTRELTLNAAAGVRAALLELEKPGHVRPEAGQLALVGHSAGGQISANLAALAADLGLPPPKAVMCVQPGRSWPKPRRPIIALADLRAIAPGTLLLAVAGDDDAVTGAIDARRIVFESSSLDPADRNLVIVHSERRDGHWLRADHAAPEAPENGGIAARRGWRRLGRGAAVVNWLDALDYYCFWKLFDALCDAAFYGLSREYALGDTPEQRFMGLWSDGRPVRPLTVEIPATGSGRD